jgi:hypothetical protein
MHRNETARRFKNLTLVELRSSRHSYRICILDQAVKYGPMPSGTMLATERFRQLAQTWVMPLSTPSSTTGCQPGGAIPEALHPPARGG